MISRFTALIPAWIWTKEMARFLFIWMVMLGAMIGVRDGIAFRRATCGRSSDRAPMRYFASCRWCACSVFALVFVWYGIRFVQFGWNQTSELADLPMPWISSRGRSPGSRGSCSAGNVRGRPALRSSTRASPTRDEYLAWPPPRNAPKK